MKSRLCHTLTEARRARCERWRGGQGAVAVAFGVCLRVFCGTCLAEGSFVYETPGEFLTSGDFNGDGVADVLVLDKVTGNARVGYADTNGVLFWSAPLPTGVEAAAGCAVGRFLQTTRDAVAATSPALNEVNLVDLSATNTAPAPVSAIPPGIGPHTLVDLADPLGGSPPAYHHLLVASSANAPPEERLDLLRINSGAATALGQFAESGPFDRGNSLQFSGSSVTFAAGLVRGVDDTFDVWQFTNVASMVLSLTNLPPGGDYAFGVVNGEALPRFVFYQAGASNLTLISLSQSGGGLAFAPSQSIPVAEAIEGVFYLDRGGAEGGFIIQFADGIQGLELTSSNYSLTAKFSAGASAGNVFSGVVPLGGGRLALLDAPLGNPISAHAQVLRFDGRSFLQLSSSNLPTVSSPATRANVWLFQSEPFVNRQPGLIASINDPDWADATGFTAGTVTAVTESDRGPSKGLGNAVTNSLGVSPLGAAFALPNQYADVISIFSYASPRPPAPITVDISPAAGIYAPPIQVSFATLNPSDAVYYRLGPSDSWHLYATSVPLTNNTTVQYYGTNALSAARSSLLTAAYILGATGISAPTLDLNSGRSSTNPPTPSNTPVIVPLSSVGTLFYGRRSVNNKYSIWAINYDGSDDQRITEGARPRASRDGHYLAFLRGNADLVTENDVWIRDLTTGVEMRLYANSNFTICYDWELNNTQVVFDWACWLWSMSVGSTSATQFPMQGDCYDDAPAVDPALGRIAFHNLNSDPTIAGLYVTGPSGIRRQRLNVYVPGASWPEWSPNGQRLAFVNGDTNQAFTADGGTNLYVVRYDGANLSQITAFHGGDNFFPHGAIWSPSGGALVGAGSLFGTNGLWIIPLTPDFSQCDCPPILLPTTPGDAIDFAGSIVVPPTPLYLTSSLPPQQVKLNLMVETNSVSISWSANLSGYHLESAVDLTPGSWQEVDPLLLQPDGNNFIYQESPSGLQAHEFFRLQKP